MFFWGCAQESRRGRWRGVFFARGCHYWRRCTQRLYKAALWKTPSGRCSPLGGASPPAPPRVPHQVRDDGAIAPLYHCLRRCPFPPSPPKVTAQTRRLCCWHRWRRCTQGLYHAPVYHHRGCAARGQKNGEHCRVLPVVVVAGRPRLAECGSELVFKRFAQLVHDGVDLLVGKRLLRVLEYEADGV